MTNPNLRDGRTRPGPAEREPQRLLREEHHRNSQNRDGAQASNAETALDDRVADTAVDYGLDAAPALLQGQKNVIAAAREASLAEQDSAVQAADPTRTLRDQAHTERHRESLARPLDPDQPLVSGRFLAASELAFAFAEGFFWANTFQRDVDSTVPWYGQQRLGAYLLAVLLPLAGIIAARWVGATWQRLLRHPADDRQQRRNQKFGAAAALSLLAAIASAIFYLVEWRFSPQGIGLGGKALPATCMAVIFAGILLADAIGRAFMTSEQYDQDERRDKAWEMDRRRAQQAAARRTAAEERWVTAWLALRNEVSTTLGRVQRAVHTGAWILLAHRAVDEHGPDTRVVDTAPAPTGSADEGLLVPRPEATPVLNLPGVPKVLHAVQDAVDVLHKYQPPRMHPENQLTHITRLLGTLPSSESAPVGEEQQHSGAELDVSDTATTGASCGEPDRQAPATDGSGNGAGPHGPKAGTGPLKPFEAPSPGERS